MNFENKMSVQKVKLSVEMELTIPQALAVEAMFKHWNYLSNIGASRVVGFFVDGDGNFHPKCKVTQHNAEVVLTEELKKLACENTDVNSHKPIVFDYNSIAVKLNK